MPRKPKTPKPVTPETPAPPTKYRAAVRARMVKEASPAYAAGLAVDAIRLGSGSLRRKNFNVDQTLLDRARTVLGVETDTEAVALSLAAVVEQAVTRDRMVRMAGELGRLKPLEHDPDELRDFSRFYTA